MKNLLDLIRQDKPYRLAKEGALLGEQSGSVLVIIVVAIVLVSAMGVNMLVNNSTVGFIQLGAVETMNGYFLAETGKTYAVTKYIIPEMEAGGNPDTPTTGTMDLLDTKEFTIPNTNSSFRLSLSHSGCPGSSCIYTLQVTGVPSSITSSERMVTYVIEQDM